MGVCAKMLKNSSQRGQQQPLCQLPWQTIFKVSILVLQPLGFSLEMNLTHHFVFYLFIIAGKP